MTNNEKVLFMEEIKKIVIGYLEEQRDINIDALQAYANPLQDDDPEVKRMRETEAIRLRDRVNELKRHIAVIKRMIPSV
ncbi:hypothetical protein [Chitinophaga sp. YIM B06452]|uniref:hypothetical protein n=1 Tax=Chitinophaga sp. YIM B06452 TaxID=3082158 RepID=UPI0031FF326E